MYTVQDVLGHKTLTGCPGIYVHCTGCPRIYVHCKGCSFIYVHSTGCLGIYLHRSKGVIGYMYIYTGCSRIYVHSAKGVLGYMSLYRVSRYICTQATGCLRILVRMDRCG